MAPPANHSAYGYGKCPSGALLTGNGSGSSGCITLSYAWNGPSSLVSTFISG